MDGTREQKKIVIIGASHIRRKFGNKAVRAYLESGYKVFAVNDNAHVDGVEGLPIYRSVLDIPEPVELASVYLPAEKTLLIVDEIAKKGIKEIFLNPGAENPVLVAALEAKGVTAIQACSIVATGKSPSEYTE